MKNPVFSAAFKPTSPTAEAVSKPPTPLAYSTAGAAKMLSVSCRTIARLTKAGHLHPSRALRRPIYSHADLVQFLETTSKWGGASFTRNTP